MLSLHWGSLVGNVLLLVSGFRMLHYCMLVDVHFLTSNVLENYIISNLVSTSGKLSTTAVGNMRSTETFDVNKQINNQDAKTQHVEIRG